MVGILVMGSSAQSSSIASVARITPAYHEDRGEAREYLRCALAARLEAGYLDSSTCPERLIYNYLWLDARARRRRSGSN